jgi:ecotin
VNPGGEKLAWLTQLATIAPLRLSAPSPRRTVTCGAAAALAAAGGLITAASVAAVPLLNLKPYPAPPAGQNRWVVQLPGVLPPNPDPSLSPSPADWRVELIVGREMEVDCNRQFFKGRIASETLKGWGYKVYRVSDVGPVGTADHLHDAPGAPAHRVQHPYGAPGPD